MASNGEQYDPALLAILQNEGKVAPFIDVLLGFLYRRTDFFRIMKTETDKLGFPPGVACKLLMNIFKKYEALAAKDGAKVEAMKRSREQKTEKQEKKEAENVHSTDSTKCNATVPPKDEELDERGKEELSSTSEPVQSTESMDTTEAARVQDRDEPNDMKKSDGESPKDETKTESGKGDEEEEDPEQARERRELQANPLTYNGAEREAYFWSQTITETDVRVKVPKSIVKGRQVQVVIQNQHLKVSHQTEAGQWSVLVDNQLTWAIDKEESMWTLSPGEFVHINLEKRQERWWENVFVDEPKINTRKIDCSRPMTDLDDEAQAKIEEMMYNQRQKQLGLPQSHEQKTHEMLRKAWDAEGSPFKGQTFDPSKFSVDPNGVVNFNQ